MLIHSDADVSIFKVCYESSRKISVHLRPIQSTDKQVSLHTNSSCLSGAGCTFGSSHALDARTNSKIDFRKALHQASRGCFLFSGSDRTLISPDNGRSQSQILQNRNSLAQGLTLTIDSSMTTSSLPTLVSLRPHRGPAH
jgi:hypothetical protein